MSGTYRPAGYNSVSPYLIVRGAQRVADFLKAAFGATELRRYDLPDGSIMHVEFRIEDTVVMMGEAGDKFPPIEAHLHLYVADVDAVYKKAIAAGGIAAAEPSQRKGDPDRRGSVKDPGGNTWSIATQVMKD